MTDKYTLAVATTNQGKLKEIERLLGKLEVDICSLKDFPELGDIIEDGATFRENALKKARELYRHCGLPTIADDSGLVVFALDGRPGVESARYAGPDSSDRDKYLKLIEEMKEVADGQRGCAFVCNLAFVDGETEQVFEGELKGEVLREPRGDTGFGYDPIFLLPDLGKSISQISMEEKNKISHRGQALHQFIEFYRDRIK
jgi:XTP/dITP diphosphohydrolase